LGVVTVTSTIPAEPAGVSAGEVVVIDVAVFVKMGAAMVPNLTAVAPTRFVPVIVTGVLPAEVPVAGEMLVTAGTELNVAEMVWAVITLVKV
jgi:hypothetical protein